MNEIDAHAADRWDRPPKPIPRLWRVVQPEGPEVEVREAVLTQPDGSRWRYRRVE